MDKKYDTSSPKRGAVGSNPAGCAKNIVNSRVCGVFCCAFDHIPLFFRRSALPDDLLNGNEPFAGTAGHLLKNC